MTALVYSDRIVALQTFHFNNPLEKEDLVPHHDLRLPGRYRLPFLVQGQYAIATKHSDTRGDPDTYLVYDWVQDKLAVLSRQDRSDAQPVRLSFPPARSSTLA